jgi:hypothetical protein
MSVETVVVKLNLNYSLRPAEERLILEGGAGQAGQSLDQWRRSLSERFLLTAVEKLYGQELPRKEQKIFRGIKRALDAETLEIELNGTEFEWLCDAFLGAKAEDKVTFPAIWAEWSGQWMDYLEETRTARKAAAA